MSNIVIIPLGTISPYQKENRNCPGFLVRYKDNNILLDCGNGISRYLKFPQDLNNLNIFITHLHKDHYGDILSIAYASLIYNKLGYLNQKINVYIPSGDLELENIYDDDGLYVGYKYVNNIDYKYLLRLEDQSFLNFIPYGQSNEYFFDDLKVNFKKCVHNINTYSIKLETNNMKIVYSSDTGFNNNNLEDFASYADIFICESTFLKGQNKTEDTHLFAYEAALIASRANVNKLYLTHFWPEIDPEEYLNEAKTIFKNTYIAKENQQIILRRK